MLVTSATLVRCTLDFVMPVVFFKGKDLKKKKNNKNDRLPKIAKSNEIPKELTYFGSMTPGRPGTQCLIKILIRDYEDST